MTFETTRGISAQPSSSLSSHSARKEATCSVVQDQEDQTCKDGGDVLELGVGDGRVAKDCNSKHFCEPEALLD